MTAGSQMARYAARYCELGLALTWTPRGQKGPRHAGWNLPENAITDPRAARVRWGERPMDGIAALLAPSGLVSLDIDDEAKAPKVLQHFGVDLNELRANAPCIVGRHFRLLYRAPASTLKHRSITWPKQKDMSSSSVLFEFRSGAISDTLPPTVHPGTGQPYRWENPPRNGFPCLPSRLLELWQDWPEFNRQALALCPWAAPQKPAPLTRERSSQYTGPSIIQAFNAAHDVTALLEAHGYQKRGERFTAPDSGHAPGVSLLDNGKIFCHHQGDPLRSEHALDCFDVYRVLDHGGDFRSAVRAAAQALGLDQGAQHGHR